MESLLLLIPIGAFVYYAYLIYTYNKPHRFSKKDKIKPVC